MGNACANPVYLKSGNKMYPSLEKTKQRLRSMNSLDTMVPDLAPHERHVIVATWQDINFGHTDKGLRVFELMMRSPEIKALFPFRNVANERLRFISLYREHASRIIECVAAVVDEIEIMDQQQDGDVFSTTSTTASDTFSGPMKIGLLLYSLGQAHGRIHGISPEFFLKISHEYVIRALMTVWREEISAINQWDPVVELAWAKLFRYMASAIYRGIVFDSKLVKTQSSTGSEASSVGCPADFNNKTTWFSAIAASVVGKRRVHAVRKIQVPEF